MIASLFSKLLVDVNAPHQLSEVYRNNRADEHAFLRSNYNRLYGLLNATPGLLGWIFAFSGFMLALEGKFLASALGLAGGAICFFLCRSFKNKSDAMEVEDARVMASSLQDLRRATPVLFKRPDNGGYVASKGEFTVLSQAGENKSERSTLLKEGDCFYTVEIRAYSGKIMVTQSIITKDAVIIELRSDVAVAQGLLD